MSDRKDKGKKRLGEEDDEDESRKRARLAAASTHALPSWQRDDLNRWKRDDYAEKFVVELLGNDYEDLRDPTLAPDESQPGVQVLRLTTALQPSDTEHPHLFTRPASRAVFDRTHEYLTKGIYPIIITGNPGLGKSRSLFYLLRRLLKDNQFVILELRKGGVVYAFVPPAEHGEDIMYRVYSVPLNHWDESCPATKKRTTWHLVDSNPTLNAPLFAGAKLVYVPSAQRKHSHVLEKDQAGILMMAPWTLSELQAAATIMPIAMWPGEPRCLTSDEVKARHSVVGGVPRAIFALPLFAQAYVAKLISDVQRVDKKLMSAFVTYNAQIDFTTSDPPSRLIMLTPDSRGTPSSWGPASEFAAELLLGAYYEAASDTNMPIARTAIGEQFEKAMQRALARGGVFNVTPCAPLDPVEHTLTLPRGQMFSFVPRADEKNYAGFLQQWSTLPPASESPQPVSAAPPSSTAATPSSAPALSSSTPQRQLWTAPKNFPAIDAMDACNRAYQITISQKHCPPPATQWPKMLDKVGAKANQKLDFFTVFSRALYDEKRKQATAAKTQIRRLDNNKKTQARCREWIMVFEPMSSAVAYLAFGLSPPA